MLPPRFPPGRSALRLVVGAVLTLGLTVAAACGSEEPPSEGRGGQAVDNSDSELAESNADYDGSPRARVEIARLITSQGGLQLELPGEVEGSRDALLASSLGGYVERVQVSDGDQVRRNQILARVDSATHSARVAQARVELDAAQRELQRSERLGDAISGAQLDAARSRVAAAAASQRLASVSASRAVIRAPFAGVVADVNIDMGEVAAPGAPLMRVVILDPVKVVMSVPDRDVVTLREGMPVSIVVDAQGGVFPGEISHIHPTANTRTRAFEVEVEAANPNGRLLPGMIATVRVGETAEAGELPSEMLIPQDWVVTKREGLGVFVESRGTVAWRPVTLGRVVRNLVVVEEGIAATDRVVITGHRALEDGDPVLVVREGTCCTSGRVRFGAAPTAAAPSGTGPHSDTAADDETSGQTPDGQTTAAVVE